MNPLKSCSGKVVVALAWEFWARGWLFILLAPLGALVPSGLLFALMKSQSHFPVLRGTEEGALIYFILYWPVVAGLGGALFTTLGRPKFRYTLPAPSRLLVGVPMMCAVATIFVQFALVAGVESAVFDAGWPVWGPALLAAVLLAFCYAVYWSTSNSRGARNVASLTIGLLLAYGIARAAPRRRFVASGLLFDISPREAVGLAFGLLLALAIATGGFAWLRHGSGFDFDRIVEWLRVRFRRVVGSRRRPFASPSGAQWWLEWCERGYILPVEGVLVGIPLLLLARFVPAEETVGMLETALALWSLFLLPPLLAGLLWGSRSRTLDFGHFGGSRPLTDRQIAAAILKSATASLLAYGLMCMFFGTIMVFLLGRNESPDMLYQLLRRLSPLAHPAPWCLAALIAWSLIGLIASVTLAGRRVTIVFLCALGTIYLLGALVTYFAPTASRSHVMNVYATIFIAGCVVGCLAAFVFGLRRALIAWPVLLVAVAILSLGVWAAHTCDLTTDWKNVAYVLACSALLPIPLAAAPLAVFVNRHC